MLTQSPSRVPDTQSRTCSIAALAALAADLGVTRLQRPSALASNATDGHALFAWECAQVPPADLYLQTLCTAPFVNAATVQRAIETLQKSPEHDSLVAITRAKQYTWSNGEPDYGRGRIPNSVDLPAVTIEAMSLYIVRASVLSSGKRFGAKPLLFELSPTEAIDVNWPEELVLAETIAAGERAQENLRLAALTPYLTSAMLSDITHELNAGGPLPREITGGGRFFGRAKTMLLDRVGPDESWRGIYDADWHAWRHRRCHVYGATNRVLADRIVGGGDGRQQRVGQCCQYRVGQQRAGDGSNADHGDGIVGWHQCDGQ